MHNIAPLGLQSRRALQYLYHSEGLYLSDSLRIAAWKLHLGHIGS
jgi:hypothetical protein